MNKVGFGIICFGLVVVLIAVNVLSNTLSDGLCQNKVLKEIASPGGSLKAVLFARECGSANGVQLSVLNSGDALPNKPGNVFSQDQQSVTAAWDDDTTLNVRYEAGPKTYVKEDSMWVWRLPLPVQVKIRAAAVSYRP